jgi:hypothetical protein
MLDNLGIIHLFTIVRGPSPASKSNERGRTAQAPIRTRKNSPAPASKRTTLLMEINPEQHTQIQGRHALPTEEDIHDRNDFADVSSSHCRIFTVPSPFFGRVSHTSRRPLLPAKRFKDGHGRYQPLPKWLGPP